MSKPEISLPLPLKATVNQQDGAVVLVLDGELDLSAKETFEKLLDDVSASDVERLYIDLREITFIDSSGIRMLLKAISTGEEQGFETVFVPAAGAAWSLLESTGVAGQLATVDESALPR